MRPSIDYRKEIKYSLPVLKEQREKLIHDTINGFTSGSELTYGLMQESDVLRNLYINHYLLNWLSNHWDTLDSDMKNERITSPDKKIISGAFTGFITASNLCPSYVLRSTGSKFVRGQIEMMMKTYQDFETIDGDWKEREFLIKQKKLEYDKAFKKRIESTEKRIENMKRGEKVDTHANDSNQIPTNGGI